MAFTISRNGTSKLTPRRLFAYTAYSNGLPTRRFCGGTNDRTHLVARALRHTNQSADAACRRRHRLALYDPARLEPRGPRRGPGTRAPMDLAEGRRGRRHSS